MAKLELLDDRRLMSANSAPAPGFDLQFLSDVESDTAPVITETVDPVQRVSMSGGFRWFDGTSTQDLIGNGGNLSYIMCDGWGVWPRDVNGGVVRSGEPSEANTRQLADWAVTLTDTLVVDIENWAMDIRSGSQAVVNQNIARFQNIVSWIRSEQPSLKIGIYSIFPVSDLYNSVQFEAYSQAAINPVTGAWHRVVLPATSNAFAKLQNANAYLTGLSECVDYVFPAIYTSSPDLTLWNAYARNTIFEARRYGKPVIPFLMPTYHPAAGLNMAVVSQEMWASQLDLMPELAEGAIVWTDPNAPTGQDQYWITMAVNKINTGNVNGLSTAGVNGSNNDPTSGILELFISDEDQMGRFSDRLISELF